MLRGGKLQIGYLYFAVFSAGFSTLALEITASRLLGSVFGTSNLIWATIIGLILIYLMIGYFAGGRWADRNPFPRVLFSILCWGAFFAALIPLIARPVLLFAAEAFDQLEMGALLGSFLTVLILFSIPVILLGVISPFAIRLAINQPEDAGAISGRIYAISTLGSFLGTFLPVLVLIPGVGTAKTFLFISGYLFLVAWVGLGISTTWKNTIRWLWMPVVILIIFRLFGKGPIKATTGLIYETESAYNYIQVLNINGFNYLRLNEGQGIHSVYNPDTLLYDGPWSLFLSAPFFNKPPVSTHDIKRIAIIGLAAGTTARQATAVFGNVPIDGFEIDPEIIQIGKRYFGMDLPNLNAIAMDGRWGLEHTDARYDLIGLDAYRPPYIPWHMTTYEFFQNVVEHLTEKGVLVINAGRAPDDRRLINVLVGTMTPLFPTIYVVDVPGTFNTMIYGSIRPTTLQNLIQNYFQLVTQKDTHPVLVDSIEKTVLNIVPTPKGGQILTDDLAPIEQIINSMILRFVFTGNMEVLQ